MSLDLAPLLLTFKLALITTGILLLIGIPIALWLAFSTFRFKAVAEAVVSMPLVLPPTVLGFYLLVLLGNRGLIGDPLHRLFDISLVFSFEGLVVASVIYSLPFMVHPLQSGFKALPPSLMEASYTLGKSKLHTILHVLLPNMKPSILSGLILSFAHTIGEFGVVLMIGGNVPGETTVASIVVYDRVQALDYGSANIYSLILFAVTFAILILVYAFDGKRLGRL